jgi:hypothetical protein
MVRFSKPELDDLLTRAGVFEDVSPIFEGSEDLTGAKQPERLEAVNGSFSYFSMLGATPQIGRLFWSAGLLARFRFSGRD